MTVAKWRTQEHPFLHDEILFSARRGHSSLIISFIFWEKCNTTSTYLSPLMYLRVEFKHFMQKEKGLSLIGRLCRTHNQERSTKHFSKVLFQKGQYFKKMSPDVLPPLQRCGRMIHTSYFYTLWFWRVDFLFPLLFCFCVDQGPGSLLLYYRFRFALILKIRWPLCQPHLRPLLSWAGWS